MWRNEHKMPCIYETINLHNQQNGILPYRYIGSDQHDRPNYLGSNVNLKKDIDKLGQKMFKKYILERFDTIDNRSLRFEEAKILQQKNVKLDPTYYNKNDRYAPGTGIKGMKHRQKRVVSQAWKNSRQGWIPSSETRKIWSEQRSGKMLSHETKKKMSENRTGDKNPNALTWTIISPSGEKFTVVGLKHYCEQNNLSYGQIYHNRGGWVAIKHSCGKGGGRRGIR